MKGWCHWERDCLSFLQLIIDTQRADGMFLPSLNERKAIFMRRKIYDKLLDWKNTSKGRTALMIDGARCVGTTSRLLKSKAAQT